MLKSLHLAWSLIRIPHLALSLFVFPLVMSLALVLCQLIVTGLVLKAASRDSSEMTAVARSVDENNVIRRVLYGEGRKRPPIRVCRWIPDSDRGGEVPPNEECNPDRLDVAVVTPNPAEFETGDYERLFQGHVDRIHVCRDCRPDVVIEIGETGEVISRSYSIFGLAILSLPYTNRQLSEQKIQVLRNVEEIQKLLGALFLHVPELPAGIGITELKTSLPFAMNVTLLVLIALWLALRAHRKVLDYFSHNDVLLPLVAACGKGRFYTALWLLTALRVGCFLLASIPLMYFGLKDVGGEKAFENLDISALDILVWMFALIATLGLATIVASISELKHRHNFLSFLYRYVPVLFALAGAAVWGVSFIFNSEFMSYVRLAITLMPVVGMAPVFVGPVLNLPKTVLMVHAIFSIVLLWTALRHNARWFAAHLEEV